MTLNKNVKEKMPKNWLIESILVTCFCCLPFGIAGIIYAIKVEAAFYAGNIEEAQDYANNAKKWTTYGFQLALFGIFAYFFLMILLVVISV